METLRLKAVQIGSGLVAVALVACGGNAIERPGSPSGGSGGTGGTASGGAGAVISATSSVSLAGSMGPNNVNLTVRDATGSLLFYLADVAYTSNLTLPDGFGVSLGDAVCDGESSCGSWSHYSFLVQGAGSSVDLPYLGSATLGEYRIQHAGAEQQTNGGIKCWDWTVAHVALGIRPLH